MKATRTGMQCESKLQIRNFQTVDDLIEKISEVFDTRNVFRIAERAGLKIVYQKWHPVTSGEFDWKSKTIYVNENAKIEFEKIIAHELGHFFIRSFGIKNISDEEGFCNQFADEILRSEEKFHAMSQS